VCVCIHIHTNTHTHAHEHTHKHTHTNIHTHPYTHAKKTFVHVYICTLMMVNILTNIGEAGDDTCTDEEATQRVISRTQRVSSRNRRHYSLDKHSSCSPGTCNSRRFMYIYVYAQKHALFSNTWILHHVVMWYAEKSDSQKSLISHHQWPPKKTQISAQPHLIKQIIAFFVHTSSVQIFSQDLSMLQLHVEPCWLYALTESALPTADIDNANDSWSLHTIDGKPLPNEKLQLSDSIINYSHDN